MAFESSCLRRVGNWSFMTKDHKFDKKTFNKAEVLNDLELYSPKAQSLMNNIRELDEQDLKIHGKLFKHFIFSDVKQGGYGVKVLTAVLLASGFNLAFDNKIKLLPDGELLKTKGENILLLSSTTIYNNTITVKAKKAILGKYNQRPENVYGDLARIILLDGGFKEGIDLFDVKYVHIYEPQTSKADQKQAIGRATRLCGQKGLEFHPKQGWPLLVFLYDVLIPQSLSEKYNAPTIFKMFLNHSGIDLRKIEFADELEKYSIISAIDYELTKNVHRFKIDDDETNLEWLFGEGAKGGAPKKRPEIVKCDGKCSFSRPTKDIPLSFPLLAVVSFSMRKETPDLRKGGARAFFCKELKTDPAFCKESQLAWKDPIKYIKDHEVNIQDSLTNKRHLKLPSKTRAAIFRLIYTGMKKTIEKKVNLGPITVTSKAPQLPASQNSIQFSPNSTPKGVMKTQTPVSIPEIKNVQSQSVKSDTIPITPKGELDIIKEIAAVKKQPDPPSKIMNFLEMRQYIRDNFIQYTWPKVQVENLCAPKGGSELVNFTPTQDFIRNFFVPASPYKGLLLFHSVGTGKCHAKDTPIIMYDGSIKLVQDIKVGDKLMGDDSTPRKVLSLANGKDEMYDIIPVKGDKYTVNSEHILVLKYSGKGCITNVSKRQPNKPFKASHIDQKTIKIKTQSFETRKGAEDYLSKFKEEDKIIEIEVKDYLKLPISTKRELKGFRKGIELPTKEVDFDPYIIGLWFGDGTSRDPKITSQDARILSYLRKELPKYGLLLNYEAQYDYRISPDTPGKQNKFLKVLQKHDLINNKHIPDLYKYNDRNTRLKVLAGFLDTDGSYSVKDKCFEITQKSDRLANDILYLARSLGFAAYLHKRKKSWTYKDIKKTDIYNTILISGNGLEDIPTLLYRKQALKRLQIKDALVTGITVKLVGKGDYYGFTLDGNNRYLLGDFTVTHNTCAAIATATTSFEKEGYTILWVTRTTLKSDIYKNMFDQVCSIVIQEKIKEKGLKIPADFSAKIRLLSDSWKIKPMSYKQFSNLVSGKNQLYQDLVKINGKEDPLRKTLLIIDEAHKLYGGGDLSSIERPDMNRLHKSIMDSYKKSGKDSVKLLLMTGTPITNDPMELIKIINLCKPENEQMETEYSKFATEFTIDEDGKFTKKGWRKYLDTVAGYISYLSRERDLRQFSQPVIVKIESKLSVAQYDSDKINGLKTENIKEVSEAKQDVEKIVNEFNQFKKTIAENKKLEKAKCKGLKKQEKDDCIEASQITIDNLNDALFTKKNDVEIAKKQVKGIVKEINKKYKTILDKSKEDHSQQGIIDSRCVKKEKKNINLHLGENNFNYFKPVPSSSKSDTESIKYSPKPKK